MSTPLTNAGSYLPVAEYLKRADQRTVSRWASDATVAVQLSALTTDPNVAAALLSASGMLESACLVGERYQPSDLLDLTGAGLGYLYQLLTWLTTCLLWERRPLTCKDEPAPSYVERAFKELEKLAAGQRIFSLAEKAQAGVADYDVEYPEDIEQHVSTVQITRRLFGRRTNDYGWNR